MSILRRRLYRSRKDRMLTGLLGGVAEYLGDIDPTVVRLAYVFLTIFTAFIPGIAAYIIGSAIVPDQPVGQKESTTGKLSEPAPAQPEAAEVSEKEPVSTP
jgi:phage shock protein C